MCFETTKSAKAKIATEDIVCYKILYPKFFRHSFESPCENFHYTPNKTTKQVTIKLVGKCINKGYHSYKTKNIAKRSILFSADSHEIYKFIIPQGTRYYKNKTEYVSETIILVE
jgi:hypothetical protein